MRWTGRIIRTASQGDEVRSLHRTLSDLGLTVTGAEAESTTFGDVTRDAVLEFQRRRGLLANGEVDATTALALDRATERLATTRTVRGVVTGSDRAGAGGLTVRLLDRYPDGDVVLGETLTDPTGRFEVAYGVGQLAGTDRPAADAQVQVLLGDTMLGTSEVRYGAGPDEYLDVELTGGASATFPAEHDSLVAAVRASWSGPVRDLTETGEQPQLTSLAYSTGWDARAVAMSALADRFAERTGTAELTPDLFYALFRAGVPAEETAVYRVEPDTAGEIWRRAAEQGVIGSGVLERIPAAVDRFREVTAATLLAAPVAPGGRRPGRAHGAVCVRGSRNKGVPVRRVRPHAGSTPRSATRPSASGGGGGGPPASAAR